MSAQAGIARHATIAPIAVVDFKDNFTFVLPRRLSPIY
jgi:hypothetical protein